MAESALTPLLRIDECRGITPDNSMVFATISTGRLKEWLEESPENRKQLEDHLLRQARLCREKQPPFELPKSVKQAER